MSYKVYNKGRLNRTQSILDREEKEETLKLLMRLKKNAPLKIEQREKLLESIKTLNEKMGVGAKPQSQRTSPVSPHNIGK